MTTHFSNASVWRHYFTPRLPPKLTNHQVYTRFSFLFEAYITFKSIANHAELQGPDILLVLGALLVVCGTYLRVCCYHAFSSSTPSAVSPKFQTTSTTPLKLDEPTTFTFTHSTHSKLVTWGPYAFVRHPSYTAVALVRLGIWMALVKGITRNDPGPIGALECVVQLSSVLYIAQNIIEVCTLTLFRAFREEAILRALFRDMWEKYVEKVKWRYVPWVL